ncbi:hypothetical protein K3495_g11604 [Podosphaera aphanis]|nr:hypothetical protein K3495_g11604 [Podosphaera aphanis]
MLPYGHRIAAAPALKTPTSLRHNLKATADAATARVQEASLLFGEEASFLDIQAERESLKNLPPHMLKAYESYRSDLAEVATWHFQAYINGAANVNSPVHNAQTPAQASPVPAMPTRATTPAPATPGPLAFSHPTPTRGSDGGVVHRPGHSPK